jgi:phosphatidate cytidylyltransferase
MSPFWSRIAVGIPGIVLVLGLTWLGGWWLAGLLVAAGLIALHEFYGLARPLRPLVPAGYAGAVLAIVGARLGGVEWALAGFMATLLVAFLLNGVAETRAPANVAVSSTVLGSAWVGLGLAHLQLLRQLHPHGRLAAFTVLIAIFAAATLAYFVGRLIGRHKLAPVVSPGKSWEGFVAGLAAAVFATFVCLYDERNTFLTIWQALVLGAVLALTEVCGDLFESSLKRDMDVKDSGRLLAGHGGVLDRIDGLLFAAVAGYYVFRTFA